MKFKEQILECIAENIRAQIDPDSLVAHVGAFNLETADTLEDRKIILNNFMMFLEWTVNMRCRNNKMFYFNDEIKPN